MSDRALVDHLKGKLEVHASRRSRLSAVKAAATCARHAPTCGERNEKTSLCGLAINVVECWPRQKGWGTR